MSWWLLRTLAAALAALAGALLGQWLLGGTGPLPHTGPALGAGLAVTVLVAVDSLKGRRLMRWLRGSQEAPAPRGRGYWGEMGYRIERVLRLRERELERERGRLEQFLSGIEASPNGVLMLDANDQIDWCNSVAADHFGLDPVRDRRQRVTNLIRSPAFVSHLQAGRFEQPVVLASPLGRATLSVLVRPYGEGAKLVLSQDITEHERADGMRRDFVANVSHEIRTPLTVLSGFVESMASLPLSEAERQRVLQLMRQQTERMQTLVGDLLTLAQLEGSPRPAPDRWTAMDMLLQRLHADAVSLSAGRHVIRFEVEPGYEVAGNPSELASAITNLVTNAVRYTPEEGRIELAWRVRPDQSGELEVRDTGIGIAREHIPRLTERFYRVDGSRSRETGGTGLGLSIVKHVVQRHGGELVVESELGRGSCFRLLLPAPRVRRVRQSADQRASFASEF
ncbi:phosphate regulon sensor histidine kinase PhoR [Aquincola tertiaricarbonis]|uniref:phosphate regulon sensor histidine kinase PhoR n=1 Tax=Aquincola tertiaricarbonis TaxID=391953 RepID=UPI000614FA45|nr:phosphate regulon sensor histidine kinase PhoR [Aquincola tertiaricarbonis]